MCIFRLIALAALWVVLPFVSPWLTWAAPPDLRAFASVDLQQPQLQIDDKYIGGGVARSSLVKLCRLYVLGLQSAATRAPSASREPGPSRALVGLVLAMLWMCCGCAGVPPSPGL